MNPAGRAPEHLGLVRSTTAATYRIGPLATYLAASPLLDVGSGGGEGEPPNGPVVADESQAVVFAGYKLQDIPNYRLALQTWFRAVRAGGHLVVVVPHAFLYERQNAMPSQWFPGQSRLYTPASLMAEVEEALVPNTYRLRWLGDADEGYDYARGDTAYPVGRHEVVLVIEKITPPAWPLSRRQAPEKEEPDLAFEPPRTRVEVLSRGPRRRILLLKLDHLGDFIMGTPALERARAAFPDAEITLVVGSWNHAAALGLGLFDSVLSFDAFPRNSSEEKADVRGKVSAFADLIKGTYDLAVDLRTDHDTRILLERVRAGIKAGIGTKGEFPFLDIFLPIDATRRTEAAWSREIPARDFLSRSFCRRNAYEISCATQRLNKAADAIIWGPYQHLAPGRYHFEPFVVLDFTRPAIVRFDAALDEKPVAEIVVARGTLPALQFSNDRDGARVEFRFWGVDKEHLPGLQFYGGRLSKQGSAGVLHQSEYLLLLVELVSLRVDRTGLLTEDRAES